MLINIDVYNDRRSGFRLGLDWVLVRVWTGFSLGLEWV